MIIYKQYTKEQLDLQYNNRFHVPDFETHLQQWEQWSRIAENNHQVVKDISYGSGTREKLDIFPSAERRSKTLVFIHGGYWQKFDKPLFHFVAGAFAYLGFTTVIISYPLMPSVGMDQLVVSCDKAVGWIHENISQWNGDPDQIYIVGHSAGGHLATMLITDEIDQVNKAKIKGVCCLSGLFDLIPIQLSNINDVLQMDKETAKRNSPILKKPIESCQVLISVGTEETEEFKDQSRSFASQWKSKRDKVELLEIPGLNHFTILSSINNPNSLLHTSILKMMMSN